MVTNSVKSDATNANRKRTLLGYELDRHQDALVNYLVPSIGACILYMFIIASDIAVIFRHYKDGDPIWASLTLFLMFAPSIGSYMVIVSNWELWPDYEGFGDENRKWLLMKTLEHLFFPIWNMWRFAERIFWSIEAVRATEDEDVSQAMSVLNSPRSIELYVFLQAYLHALPQVLLQLHILMRHKADIDRETKDAQVTSIFFNLVKLSITTTYYQRFKSQKIAGKQYPWYKSHKIGRSAPSSVVDEETVQLRRPIYTQSRSVIEDSKRESSRLSRTFAMLPSLVKQHRRSSDIYLEPTPTTSQSGDSNRQTTRASAVRTVRLSSWEETTTESVDEVDGQTNVKQLSTTTKQEMLRETSVLDGPQRQIFRQTGQSEPDFNISRVIYVKGLEDDDLAGKLIAFTWWFAFLLARILAVSVFGYFFMKETLYILVAHFILVVAILVYDVRSDYVRRGKAFFFLFLGFVYVFCIIEFKIRFKKAYFIYYGFFLLVFLENIVMCLVWYNGQLESIENDFWFRYIFYMVIMCTLISFCAMVFYFMLVKPKSVLIPTTVVTSGQRYTT